MKKFITENFRFRITVVKAGSLWLCFADRNEWRCIRIESPRRSARVETLRVRQAAAGLLQGKSA